MKRGRYAILAILVLAVAAIVTTNVVRAAEEPVSLDTLPDAVREAIQDAVGAGTIHGVAREREGGRVVYEVEATVDGKRVEMEYSDAGALLETETADDGEDDGEDDEGDSEAAVTWEELPAAVQAALAAEIPGVAFNELTREVEGGATYYELEYEGDGTEHGIELTEDGYIVETESEVDVSSLPAGVQSFLQSRYEGAQIGEIHLVSVQFYEIELKSKGRNVETQVLANGHRIEVEDEGDDD